MKRYSPEFNPSSKVLLIVPPFATIQRPGYGVHLLQAVAQEQGGEVSVLYANILLATLVGESNYWLICFSEQAEALGEKFFAKLAHRDLVRESDFSSIKSDRLARTHEGYAGVDSDVLSRCESIGKQWLSSVMEIIERHNFSIIGCSTTFQQTNASLALLRSVKDRYPHVTTVMGGANCQGEMAEGLATLAPFVDHVFSGESEETFPAAMQQILAGSRPSRIIRATPTKNLDGIPTPCFDDYFDQMSGFFPESVLVTRNEMDLPYESSRGCWWGQKRQCTFCGLNGESIEVRQKSPERVLAELKTLTGEHPTNRVFMLDNCMPPSYFRDLLPRLREELPGLCIFYEQRADLTLEEVVALQQAGVRAIQPGIESLSSGLLRLMRKGVTARRNLDFLRYARSAGTLVRWYLLCTFPGDLEHHYTDMLDLIPKIRHLSPPDCVRHLRIDRFSPYFNSPLSYNMTNVRPVAAYRAVFPEGTPIASLAYCFEADYDSACRRDPTLITRLNSMVADWRERWLRPGENRPVLALFVIGVDDFMLLDTRNHRETEKVRLLNREQAELVLLGPRGENTVSIDWAVDADLLVEVDGRLEPLATADLQTWALLKGNRNTHGGSFRAKSALSPRPDSGEINVEHLEVREAALRPC